MATAKKKPAEGQAPQITERPTTTVALHSLERHPNNVRRVKPTGIAELAESIAKDGLLNPLTVCSHPTEAQVMLVCAGGRRLEALELLANQKRIPDNYAVIVRVVQPEEAEAISLTENQMREQMHPIDQFEAFKAQVDSGKTITDVAARFGVTEQFVKQRLKLASVSPKVIDQYRKGKLTLEQLQAFTVSDDHKAQEKVLSELDAQYDDAADIRHMLTADAITADSPILKYVGKAAYQKAGGAIIDADLFSDDGEQTISDQELLNRLAQEKLEKQAEKLRKDEGLAWCEAWINFPYVERAKFAEVPTVERKMTAAEAKQYKAIESKLEAKQKELDELQQQDDFDSDVEDKLCEEVQELEDQRDAMDEACKVPHPDVADYVGAVVTINHSGKLEIHRNLIRSGDLKKIKTPDAPEKKKACTGADGDAQEQEAPSGYSEKLTRRLIAHKTAILRNQIARTKCGAGILVYHMLLSDYGIELDLINDAPLTMHTTNDSRIFADGEDMGASESVQVFVAREGELLEPIRKELKKAKGNKDQALYDFIMSATTDYQLELLSFLVATQIRLVPGDLEKTAVLERDFLTDLIVSEAWKPTRESYLDHVSKAQIIADVTEAKGDACAAMLAPLKKPNAAERAEEMLEGTDWLPKPMRVVQS